MNFLMAKIRKKIHFSKTALGNSDFFIFIVLSILLYKTYVAVYPGKFEIFSFDFLKILNFSHVILMGEIGLQKHFSLIAIKFSQYVLLCVPNDLRVSVCPA